MFLRAALGAGAATAVGSVLGAPAAGDPVTSGSGGMPDWEGLRRGLRGRLLLPWEPDYFPAKLLHDTRFDAMLPAAVVRAADEDDVSAAVSFAAAHHLTVAPRGGGHSYVGASAADRTLVLDLRDLNAVRLDSGNAHLGGGALIAQAQDALGAHGRTIPLGTCPTVGVTGLALGGGIGVDSRARGLTCDRLLGARVVLPDGTKAEVSATDHPDLFWALRGGGRCAVVTELTVATHPAESKDLTRLSFPGEAAARTLLGWANWLATASRAQWANVEVRADGHGGVACVVLLVGPAGTGSGAAAGLARAIGAQPTTAETRTLEHAATALELAGGTRTPSRTSLAAGSDVLTDLTPDAADALVAAVTDRSRTGGSGGALVDPLDGAVRDIPANATAFPWRTHTALVQWIVYNPTDHAAATEWIARAHHRVGPHSAGGYLNYPEVGHPAHRYLAGNHARLRDIANTIDPDHRIGVHPAL
ncbi:FAD-binding oxidoreductase [Nocardia puris]|uniref:FAD-binding oxidoreductase n=1 Tax=Nocardia puris TaxID=208602 RepID=UPI0018962328|nr:FAD-binding oxidoreductase [Nocardia puris]MBF6212436.1 FAD-binding oxidoreductase [Nocardia puris]MBF6366683.1 FAD-binding oxidoreductase [Nocardia puris]MBF6461025.1 FAD-binding oxidoreductase [Nocardia puris]